MYRPNGEALPKPSSRDPRGNEQEGIRQGLASLVGAALSVAPRAICGPGRGTAEISHARQLALYLAHTTLGLSFTEAGRLFGRDRTTAAHACRRIEDRRDEARVDQLVACLERAARDAVKPSVRSRSVS
ncbi:helix-turn-helix domain-containing protein [Kaistia adipata]|uniref:helix-turn-helix domain-containing protein n=1 Tax=Kaistia adipata TaxID=166954 RepID=UPI0012EC2420|nr:helix-turn-helix domain-containing protein [Kaistia adipata]